MTINKKRLNISLKPKVPGDLLNSKTRRLNGNSSKVKDINDFLDYTNVRLFQIYQDLKYKGEVITSDLVKFRYLGEEQEIKKVFRNSLLIIAVK